MKRSEGRDQEEEGEEGEEPDQGEGEAHHIDTDYVELV